MNYLYVLIVIISAFTGIVMVIFGLPGTFIAWSGVFLTAVLNNFQYINLKLLIFFLLITIAGEALEFISGVLGARKYGASTKGIMGAIVGGMAGAVVMSGILPGIGTVAGLGLGTFSGAFIGEYVSGRDIISSSKAGWGAFLGRVFAIGIKVIAVLFISALAISKYFSIL